MRPSADLVGCLSDVSATARSARSCRESGVTWHAPGMAADDRDGKRPAVNTGVILLEVGLTALSVVLLGVLLRPVFTDDCMGGCLPTPSERVRARIAAIVLVFSYCGEIALAVRRGGTMDVAVHGLFGVLILAVLAIAQPF